MLKLITEGELSHIKDTLSRMVDEIEAIKEDTDHVFTSGVEEGIEESLEIVEAILRKIYEEEEKELDSFFESIDTEAIQGVEV